MYTQNTQIHITLWQRSLWFLALANMLMSSSVFMLMPTLPFWMKDNAGFSCVGVGIALGLCGVGQYALGCFCSYLTQRHRRNKVCMWATLAMATALGLLWTCEDVKVSYRTLTVFAAFLLIGVTFGLANIVLSSVLVIDRCESSQRTEANYVVSWFRRLSWAVGPLSGITAFNHGGFDMLMACSCLYSLIALVLVASVRFPFKAPDDDISLFSTDRFFLRGSGALFINLFLSMIAIGVVMSVENDARFYTMMLLGFALAALAQKYAFVNAELKSETITGLLLMASALAMRFVYNIQIVDTISPVLTGMGSGIICSRFLLFFIKLSGHCQRGTSQSSFFLSCGTGVFTGLAIGWAVFNHDEQHILLAGLVSIVIALIMYVTFTHRWYIKHKNR